MRIEYLRTAKYQKRSNIQTILAKTKMPKNRPIDWITNRQNPSQSFIATLSSQPAKVARPYATYALPALRNSTPSPAEQVHEQTEKPSQNPKSEEVSALNENIALKKDQLAALEKAYKLVGSKPPVSSKKKLPKKGKTAKDQLFLFARTELSPIRPLPHLEAMMLKLELLKLRNGLNTEILTAQDKLEELQ
ncbi:Oidioi.mRNA.OKI2018_I69.PAR.g10910.t1.cds [Oikopleura dioica]|uniref:Oidioi.mRNA.OKI2018_I69.PAR.g10910.t1.cds n=1 Tax=Oikopleura dioica TaxID=34765 RepID=A0ABN7RSZ6_OIKDI|nr:Oidioi.mRNA.OKI2018_I69.PAR.g10910.t1.cds [Oikopleura dioica]